MSREVLAGMPSSTRDGVLPALAPLGDGLDVVPAGPPGRRGPSWPPGSRRVTASILAGCLLVGAAAGWWAWRGWTAQARADAVERTGRADAVATGPDVIQAEPGRVVAGWSVVVHNPGRGTVDVHVPFPGEGAQDNPGFLSARPRDWLLQPGGEVTIRVETVVPCADDRPLIAPSLVVTGPDEQDRATPVTGALAVATAVCAVQPAATRPLVLDGVRRHADDLGLTVHSPTGRGAVVTAVTADGATLPARAAASSGAPAGTAVPIGRQPVTILLSTPVTADGTPTCPTTWTAGGVPQQVEMVLAGTEPVTVTVQIGLPMARWLLDVACPGEAMSSPADASSPAASGAGG